MTHRLLIERADRFQIWQVGSSCDVFVCRPGHVDGTYIRTGDLAEVVGALAKMLAENLRAELPRCTGMTAVWCPGHGHCRCPEQELGPKNEECPLHGAASTHGKDGYGG